MISRLIRNILPWIICGLAAAFYCYEYLLRITPGLIVPQLQRAFSVHGEFLDATRIGHLNLFYYYAYIPMQLAVGLFMDRYGPRWILTLAVFCCALGAVLFGVTESWHIAAIGRFSMGFGSAFAFVGVMKLASSWLPPNRFAMVSGLATTLGMVGAMSGDFVLIGVIENIGWRDTVLYSGYVGFILMPVIWLIIRDDPSHLKFNNPFKETAPVTCLSFSQLWREIRFSMKNYQIWLNGIIAGLLMAPTMVFGELWGSSYLQVVHNLSLSDASTSKTMIFLGWAIGGPLAGLFSDWIRRRRASLILGSFLVTVLLLIFLYLPGLGVIGLKALLFLIGMVSSVQVICFAVGRENCPPSLAGTVIALTNFLVVCFALFQLVFARIVDAMWDGTIVDQVKVYNADCYQSAMLILPIVTFLAFVLCFFLKETYCEPIEASR